MVAGAGHLSASADTKDALLLQAEGLVERQQAYIANLEARLERADGARDSVYISIFISRRVAIVDAVVLLLFPVF